MGRIERALNVSDWVTPVDEVYVGPSAAVRPPEPPPARCATCGSEHRWQWDDDRPLPGDMVIGYKPEPGWNDLDSEWWGKAFHCSLRCYREGSEFADLKNRTS